MSQAAPQPPIDPSRYTSGPDRYANFAEDVLDVRLTDEQRAILRAVVEHDRVIVMCGNGVGKSYAVAILKLAFAATNVDSTVLGTSGSYSQYVDAVWRPMKALHKAAKQRVNFPGRTFDGGQPTLELGDDWFAKVVSPRDPGDLEGRHAESMLIVVEEADKAYITDEHFDSAGSSITDANDRMIAICNPPEDEANPVYDKLQSDRWHVIQFSSFDSHNVRVDSGELNADKIPGLIDLETIREDWEAWNGEDWPGLEAARTAHQRRDDLDVRWYRRRAGVIPPDTASAHRPLTVADVEAAWEREPERVTGEPEATAVDVARAGGDQTIAVGVYGDTLRTRYVQQGIDHVTQANELTDLLESDPDHPVCVDAIGEGSGLADMLADRFPGVIRFNAGSEPADGTEYKDCWAEGLAELGRWLRDGGSIDDRRLREELLLAARVLEYDERHLASRGVDGSDVFYLTSKDKLKERLGRSPDRLDAAYMAVWAAAGNAEATQITVTRRTARGTSHNILDN